jgi:hypothetical protein
VPTFIALRDVMGSVETLSGRRGRMISSRFVAFAKPASAGEARSGKIMRKKRI